MDPTPCDCVERGVATTRTGTWVHVAAAKGVWCAVQGDDGAFFLQSLILPTTSFVEELDARRAVEEAERAARAVDEARRDSLAGRLEGGEDLTMAEINELARLDRKLSGS